MSWLDALGWFGSALLVFSLLQARILRLRLLNTIACGILTVFNALIEVWPMVAMNVVLAAINLWFIARMLREKSDADAGRLRPPPDAAAACAGRACRPGEGQTRELRPAEPAPVRGRWRQPLHSQAAICGRPGEIDEEGRRCVVRRAAKRGHREKRAAPVQAADSEAILDL